MKQCPYCTKSFKEWKSVRAHSSNCNDKTGEFYIDLLHGPIHYTEVTNINDQELHKKYPGTSLRYIRRCFQFRNININSYRLIWNKESIIEKIKQWYSIHKKLPQQREFNETINHPHHLL